METNYQRIQEQFGEEKLKTLIALLEELKQVRPGSEDDDEERLVYPDRDDS